MFSCGKHSCGIEYICMLGLGKKPRNVIVHLSAKSYKADMIL